jgi:hypothetical protein
MDEKRSSDTDQPGQGGSGGGMDKPAGGDQPGQGGSGGSQGSDWNKESGRGTGDTGTE